LHYYIAYLQTGLWSKRKQIDTIQEFIFGFEDTLQAPLQPLMDNLESSTYEVFEKDPVKYEEYYNAVKLALEDKNLEETIIFMVGAGRGPIVSEILKAADDSHKKVN
jgi:protein arginine N-methyltransferase 5